jgi:hypothetical protein
VGNFSRKCRACCSVICIPYRIAWPWRDWDEVPAEPLRCTGQFLGGNHCVRLFPSAASDTLFHSSILPISTEDAPVLKH